MQENDHHGLCTICGHAGLFRRGEERSIREAYACPGCRFPLRWRDQAGVIVDEFGRGQALSIDQLVASGLLQDVAIYEPALRGPFAARLEGLPGYVRSYFRPGAPLGEAAEDGVRNEDLTRLTFDDESFDLVITSDVMEHLPEVRLALAETLRVLRPGGIHVFSIPNDFPFPDRTEPRVRVEDGKETHLKPPRYHNAGDGSKCLVYTDYGADLADMAASIGGRLTVVRRSSAAGSCHANATFVLRKVAAPGAGRLGRAAPARPEPVRAEPAQAPVPAAPGPELQCPICGGTTFEAFNGRPNARCSSCRSVERNRLMWMILDRLGGFAPGKRILHCAPELGLMRRFVQLSGDAYHGTVFDPERDTSKVAKLRRLDLCTDLAGIADNSYDLILHSHVLEHVRCDVAGVLRELDRILAPGGLHLLSVPIRGERTTEDLSPNLTEAERLARFGQGDHMRLFGSLDLQAMLREVWGPGRHLIEPIELFPRDDLRRAVIPTDAWQGITGHSVFHYRKGGRPPAEALAAKRRADRASPSRSVVLREEPTGSQAASGLDVLRRDNPWPEFPWSEHAPFHLALDGNGQGGREIILRQIAERNVRLMCEVGCFLGGSSLLWLNATPNLTLVGVDPWDGDWSAYVERIAVDPVLSSHAWHLSDAEVARIAALLRSHGSYAVALNNLRSHKDRFVPVRRRSPEALHYLHGCGVAPEMIYIDASKDRADLDVAHALFPDAVLCGDDWLWPDETGRLVMQENVKAFAHQYGLEVEDKRQSWVLHR